MPRTKQLARRDGRRKGKARSSQAPKSPKQPAKDIRFPFTKLPQEIRNIIYGYALPATAHLGLCDSCDDFHPGIGRCVVGYEENGRFRYPWVPTPHAPRANMLPWVPADPLKECKVAKSPEELCALVSRHFKSTPEPAILREASKVNPMLHAEMLPVFYGQSVFNIKFDDARDNVITAFLNQMNDHLGRISMLRHLAMSFRAYRDFRHAFDFLVSKQHLSTECKITLYGAWGMLLAFKTGCRMGERLRHHGVDWKLIEATMRDSDVLRVEFEGDYEWSDDDFEEEGLDYNEFVLGDIE